MAILLASFSCATVDADVEVDVLLAFRWREMMMVDSMGDGSCWIGWKFQFVFLLTWLSKSCNYSVLPRLSINLIKVELDV